jgi:hypothetical protein
MFETLLPEIFHGCADEFAGTLCPPRAEADHEGIAEALLELFRTGA